MAHHYPGGGFRPGAIANAIATIGENMTLRRVAELKVVSDGVIGSYVHGAVADGLGKIGVIVGLESTGKADELAALGRQLAMHVAATNPRRARSRRRSIRRCWSARRRSWPRRTPASPKHVLEKITESGLRKSYAKEYCLLDQAYIHDGSKSVSQVLKEIEGKVGAPDQADQALPAFALGEGIEKEEQDFAAEVAAAGGTTG